MINSLPNSRISTTSVAQGEVTEEDAQILHPHVLARVTEMLPIARAENEGETSETVPDASTQTPTEDLETRDWVGLDAEVQNEVLEVLEQDAEAEVESVTGEIVSALVENRTLTQAEADALKTKVLEQMVPAVEELRQRQAEPPVPENRVGTETVGYQSDGVTEHRVRPVLRELDEIVPSHGLSGEKRREYPEDLQPREGRGGVISMEQVRTTARQPNFGWLLEFFKQFRDGPPLTSKRYPRRVVSGNGRTLALQLMRQDHPENWQGYQEALRAELEKVGIDPAEADAMENPVLTYELMDTTDEVEVAKDANTQSTLDATATEQAGHDAAYFDDDLMALWKDTSGNFITALKSEENQEFRNAFIDRVPTHLQPGFMTADGTDFSSTGVNRIQNAIIKYVFGDDIGGQLARIFIETDPEDFNKSLGTLIRNSVATLAHAKANGHDIGQELAAAILRFIEINTLSNRDKRNVEKKEKLYNQIELFYKDIPLLPVALIEKQLLYLLYARRTAPRRLTNDLQHWSRNAIEIAQVERGGLFRGTGRSNADIYEEIFAGIIRNTLREIAFQSREDAEGQERLLPPEKMPFELVQLREEIDKIPTVAGKEQFLSDWTDAFLKFMNDGEPQAEADITQQGDPDATQTEQANCVR